MKRRRLGLMAVSFAAAGLAALLVPIAYGQGAEWFVTVGDGAPETVEVGARATPLQLIFDGTEPIPSALRARLVLASVFAVAAIVSLLQWRRTTVE
jgi:hypothetical protein